MGSILRVWLSVFPKGARAGATETGVFAGLLALLLTGCGNLEKEIVVPQPPYTPQLVVECYLERGEPYRLALTESVNYLATPQVPVVTDATVRIGYPGQSDALSFAPVIDSVNRKGYNYTLDKPVVDDPNAEYTLEITDPKGRRVTGTTRFPSFVPLKEIAWAFDEKEKAYLTVRFDDPPGTVDYYRFVITRDSLAGEVETSFTLEDRFGTNNEITLGTGYNFEDGDSLVVSLFHISKPYFDFLESTDAAASANGNPFAQPSLVKSTVRGGIGVFTALVYDRKKIVIKQDK
ncbi:MAG: DUF4249 domain-containing protein [Ferruginibacter sp.]|nr:DUF4249 domain-containing protein [Cytophagales bacterium]